MIFCIRFLKLVLNFCYVFFKIFKEKDKITFISRQGNKPSLEYSKIIRKIKENEPKIKTVVLTKKLDKTILSVLDNAFVIFLQMYHIATSKIVVVDGYCIPISILNHKKNLIVIQLWHANGIIKKIGLQTLEKRSERDKKIAIEMNMHKNYSYVISSSRATSKVYQKAFGVKDNQILEYGTPLLDYIYNNENLNKKEILKRNPEITKKVILYLPTYRKEAIDIEKLIKEINFEKYDFVVKQHPVSKHDIRDERIIAIKDIQTTDLISIAQYVITDYSNVAFEAALINKPVLFYVYDIEKYKKDFGLNVDLLKEIPEYAFKKAEEIIKVINSEEYDMNILKCFTAKHISAFDGNSTERIVDFMLKKIRKKQQNNNKKQKKQKTKTNHKA